MERNTDLQRAKDLGMTLDQFQSLVGHDPLDQYPEFTKASEDFKIDEVGELGTVFETDRDVRNKTPLEVEHYWEKSPESEAEWALYKGFHMHTKDNVFGLHAHYPGGPLGGGHSHGPQNRLGYHTHRYNVEDLQQMKFARPGHMVELDGPHEHHLNAPDGGHKHAEENFGPESAS